MLYATLCFVALAMGVLGLALVGLVLEDKLKGPRR